MIHPLLEQAKRQGANTISRLMPLKSEPSGDHTAMSRVSRAGRYAVGSYVVLDLDAKPLSITCPKCKRVSYNLNDVRERFCGVCGYHDVDKS